MTPLTIRPLRSETEAAACARLMAASEPWVTLGREAETLMAFLREPGRESYVAFQDDQLAGCLVLNLQGAFIGYLQTICIAPAFRGMGLGTSLIAFAEERIFRDHPNVFLCVSAFNHGARRLYERLGYGLVGELTDYLVTGHSELLLRKTRGPLLAAKSLEPE